MDEHASYLKRLKFDPKLGTSVQAKYLKNPRLLILFLIIIFTAGIYSFINLPRRLNPQIDIPIVLVNTVLPGASPQDVESLVTVPIEDSLDGLDGVSKISSVSRDSVSSITLEFQSGVDPDKARDDVASAVDSVGDLPEDAQDSSIQKLDFENQPVWQFAVTSNSDYASLDRFIRNLRDRLEEQSLIDRVVVNGLEEQEVQVLLKPELFSTYQLNPQQITQAISSGLGSFPAGNLRTEGSSFALTIDKTVTDLDELRQVRISLGGEVVSLGDIAEISEKSKPEQRLSYIAQPNKNSVPAISLDVYKTTNADITQAYEQAKEEAEVVFGVYEGQFERLDILNTAELISEQFTELLRDFAITVSLVFLVLLFFLGSRQAIVSTLSVPLTFLITFTVMLIAGIELSFLAYFSLLLALGLLVDDTIVVISAMSAYFRSGKFNPFQTGLLVWRDFIVAIFTTTLTTIWAFIPLLLSSGIIGEFIKPIPIVVSTTLMASFIVAMFITLPIIVFLLGPNLPKRVIYLFRILAFGAILGAFIALSPKGVLLLPQIIVFVALLLILFIGKNQLLYQFKGFYNSKIKPHVSQDKFHRFLDQGLINFERFSNKYQRVIKKIISDRGLRVRTLGMVIIFSVFSYLLVPLGFVRNEFFPGTDEDYIYINLELPSGTHQDITKIEALEVTDRLKDTPALKYVTTNIGLSFNAEMGPGGGEASNVLFTLTLEKEREISSQKIAQSLREEFKDYQRGTLSVVEVSGGPPAGADVQIKLIGPDLTTLDQLGTRVEEYMKTQPGLTNINKSIKQGTGKLTFVPDRDRLAQNGVAMEQIGFGMILFASGFSADQIKLEGDEELDINLRLSEKSQFADSLSSVMIPSATGNIPLLSLGELILEPNPTLITREDGQRTLSISASAARGTSIPDANAKLQKFVSEELGLPAGYTWATGGANEENEKSVQSIIAAMGLSFMLIILTMVVQFSSFRKALIVMLVIPLSISGVFVIFALSNTPLSFPALIGILALFGIVVKNSILIVDKISQNIKSGIEFREAIAEGSASRLEAITLTSLATIFGLVPITLSDPLWRGLGGAIIAGLTFSGTIMVFLIPVIYYYWFRSSEGKKKQLKG